MCAGSQSTKCADRTKHIAGINKSLTPEEEKPVRLDSVQTCKVGKKGKHPLVTTGVV